MTVTVDAAASMMMSDVVSQEVMIVVVGFFRYLSRNGISYIEPDSFAVLAGLRAL